MFSSGRPCAIELHVGKLVAKERKVALLFDVARFRDYLESGAEWQPSAGQDTTVRAPADAADTADTMDALSAGALEALEEQLLDANEPAPAPGPVPALDLTGAAGKEEGKEERKEQGEELMPEEEPVDALAAFTRSLTAKGGSGGGGSSRQLVQSSRSSTGCL